MKHSELASLASLVFFAHILPKGFAFAAAVALSLLGFYFSLQGN
jgi:hypothetical protein